MTAPDDDLALSDSGNAKLVEEHHASRLRYCPQTRRWLVWDDTRWRPEVDDAAAWQAVDSVIDNFDIRGDSRRAKHQLRSRSAKAIYSAVTLARYRPEMRVALDQFDADPYALNTPDGIVDLRTGNLSPHDPAALHTLITGVGYDPGAAAPRWLAFLDETFGGDAELIGYMQRVCGYATIGEVFYEIFPFLFGQKGANGKTVLVNVMLRVLGDYSGVAPSKFLLAQRFDKHPTEIAMLRGKRFVSCSESNAGERFDEAKVKLLTGGDPLTGRVMGGNFFDFRPSHTLFMMSNHRPEVTTGGYAFYRRLKIIPFNHTVPEDRRNGNLAAELIADEGPAILAWLVAGAVEALATGLREPAVVTQETADYAEQEQGPFETFRDECLKDGDPDSCLSSDILYAAFNAWSFYRSDVPQRFKNMTLPKWRREFNGATGLMSSQHKIGGDKVRGYRGLRLMPGIIPASAEGCSAK